MQYRYAPKHNYEDFASGRVFYAQPGQPAFPVRLASEIFQRALAHWQAAGRQGRASLYDPVCGGAYWLAVLGTLHRAQIGAIFASDVDADVLLLAERNLSLLTLAGLDRRIAKIESLLAEYGKDSHAEALASARRFRQQIGCHSEAQKIEAEIIARHIFQTDATNPESIRSGLGDQRVDLVLADVPYGWLSQWQRQNAEGGRQNGQLAQLEVEQMLGALQASLNPGAVVAVAADKSQKIRHEDYIRLEKFQVGRRRVEIMQMKNVE